MFVIVSLIVNLVFCARSYATMRVLDYRELGLAALLQSVILLLGMLQFGFLNGGYRLMCSAEPAEAKRINNLVFTFIGGLAVVSLVVFAGAVPFVRGQDTLLMIGLGAVGGVATLARTWMMNHMIAQGRLTLLNKINLASSIVSIAPLALIPVSPLAACLAAVVAQPVAFVAAAALLDRSLLPDRLETSGGLVRATLGAGFMMFLMGIFLQVNLQIERWYVTAMLGLDALGHLYLAILFVTLFQMVPVSLDQVFLPTIVRAHKAGEYDQVRRSLRQFFIALLAYCVLAALAIVLLAEPVTAAVLPRYVPDLRYLYLIAPGLILFTLSGPYSIMFNVLLRFGYYFVAYSLGTAATALILLWGAVAGGALGLDGVMLLRSGVYVLMAVLIVAGFYAVTRDSRELRFALFRGAA